MKVTAHSLVGSAFAAAMALCSATSCQAAAIVVTYDTLDTSNGAVSGAPVANYLSGYGITFSSADGGVPFIVPYIPGSDPYPNAVSSPNFFSVAGSNSGFHYTLSFATLLDTLSFTVPGTGPNSTMAAWSATAFSPSDIPLDTVGNAVITFPDSQTITYTLTGPDISSVVFYDNVENFAGNHLAYDDLTLTPIPGPATLPLFVSGLGALGLLGWRRKRKAQALG